MHWRNLVVPAGLAIIMTLPAAAQTWVAGPSLPTTGAARIGAAGVNDNGTIYAIGGTPWQNGGDMDGSVHRLLPGASNWETVEPLSGMGPIVGQAAGVDALGRIVVFGGYILNDDGPGDSVTYEAVDGPTGGVTSRNAPDSATGYTAFAIDDAHRLYGIGGGRGTGETNSGYVDRYDGSADSWETLAPLPTPVADTCAAYDRNGHILVCGGINADGSARVANVARYDIATNNWSDTAVPDLPVALSGAAAACGIDGRIYVAGGETGPLGVGTTQSTVYKWEPSTNTWSTVADMATPRKHFALVLGNDDFLYAIGGDNDNGGTDGVEKLFTPRCPSIDLQPGDQTGWSGTIAGFSVSVSGATPLNYQWRRDGQPLADGPTGNGSTLSGTTTASLSISAPTLDDQAMYDVVVTNECGTSTSNMAMLTIRETPAIPTNWKVTNLHPAWAQDSSYARGVAHGRIGGEAVTATLMPDGRTLDLAHPVLWNDATSPGLDITPAGSVGGGIRDAAGDYFVGWFWHTYSCPSGGQTWTCAWQSAAYWTGPSMTFTEAPHGSGPEYDIATGTDGQQIVGTLTYEYTEGNYSSYATLWNPPNYSTSLQPSSDIASNSGANAVDDGHQYGSITTPYPGPSVRAAMWTGSAASYVDLHPAGFARSWVSGAADGQAVGTAVLGSTNHAMLWAGGPATIDLNPDGAGSNAVDADGGLQIGDVGGRAAIWAGTADSYFDLTSVLPPDFTTAAADAIEVAADGTIRIVGHGYAPAHNRYEALMWESLPDAIPGDVNCDGAVNAEDVPWFGSVLTGTDESPCHVAAADVNEDGLQNGLDIQMMVSLLLGA